MTYSGQDHYFRLVTFVVEGCPKPLIKLLLLKANNDPRPGVAFTDLGTYLQFHEPTIKQLKRRKIIRQDQYDLLFPSTGSVEETIWDISLITSLLMNLFVLTPHEMGYIQDIRDVRNEMYHISGTATVSDAEFVNKWDKLEKAVTELGKLCSNAVYKEIETFVNRLKQQPLPPADPIINKLKEWYTYETTLHEMKDNIEEGKEIASACKQIASTSKDIIKRASIVASNRSGKHIKRLKTLDTSLQKLKDHYMRTHKDQFKEEIVPRKEMEDIKTKLNEHHRVVVSGYDKSTNLSSALYAIKELDYNIDRCVQINRADDWYKVNYEDVDLVLCVDPFGNKSYNTKRANDIATIFDYALEESNEPNADTRISYVLVTSSRCLKRFRHIDDHELLNMEVVIGSPMENDSEDEHSKAMLDPILQNILAQSRLVIRKYSNDEYSNPKLQSAHEIFEENNLIVISGPRRSGKTTMAMRLLLPHKQDIGRCVVLTNPSDWKHVNVEYINIVIIEEFCGQYFYDREMASQWLNKFNTIQACIEEGKLRVMITCFDENLQHCWDEKMWHELLETSIHVDAVENDRTLTLCGPKGYVASCSSVDKDETKNNSDGKIEETESTKKEESGNDMQIYEPLVKTNSVLQKMSKKYGNKSKEVSKMCESICDQIQKSSEYIISVQPGYRFPDMESIVFLVYLKDGTPIEQIQLYHTLKTFNILYRYIGDFSKEEFEVQTYINEQNTKPTHNVSECREFGSQTMRSDNQTSQTICDTICKHSKALLDSHKNLNIMSGSSVKSKRMSNGQFIFEDEHCIVFYVRVKGFVPLTEEVFPPIIDNIVTDVREAAFEFFQPNDFHEKIKIGSPVGPHTENSEDLLFGTVGPIVEWEENGKDKVGCITSAHAVFSIDVMQELVNNKLMEGFPEEPYTMYSPTPNYSKISPSKTNFGTIKRAVYNSGEGNKHGVEAVLIEISDRTPDNGETPSDSNGKRIVFNSVSIFDGDINKISQRVCWKYGTVTGLTKGTFETPTGSVVRTDTLGLYNDVGLTRADILLHNQIKFKSTEGQCFAKKGDSGSLVAVWLEEKEEWQAIGLLTGGHCDGSSFYVTPLNAILKN